MQNTKWLTKKTKSRENRERTKLSTMVRRRMGPISGLILCFLTMAPLADTPHARAATEEETPTQPSVTGIPPGNTFVEIARQVTPFVVNISARRVIEHPPIDEAPLFRGPFEDFFRRFREEEQFETEGLGSGVIFREDGYILTNNHVVEKAEEIQVSIYENEIHSAEVIGRDPTTDLAVIKIDRKGLHTAKLGDSDRSQVGEWVLAVGNPMRLPFTVTAGIISAKGRNIDIIPGSYSIESFIQTDAAINPGNSGGPLINLNGEVIGINTAISTNTGFYQGYGFAIPISLARRVAGDIIEHGRVIRPILGVSIRNVTPERAGELSLPEARGVVVEGFVPDDSPAREAGIEEGDVIVDINGVDVSKVNELQTLIARYEPGDGVTVGIIRDGERLTRTVYLMERPSKEETVARSPEIPAESPFGIRFENVSDAVMEIHGMSEQRGVAIADVDPDGPAARASPHPLRAGDVLLEIERGTVVASVEDLEERLSRLRGESEILLYVSRSEETGVTRHFTVIEPEW